MYTAHRYTSLRCSVSKQIGQMLAKGSDGTHTHSIQCKQTRLPATSAKSKIEKERLQHRDERGHTNIGREGTVVDGACEMHRKMSIQFERRTKWLQMQSNTFQFQCVAHTWSDGRSTGWVSCFLFVARRRWRISENMNTTCSQCAYEHVTSLLIASNSCINWPSIHPLDCNEIWKCIHNSVSTESAVLHCPQL